jgi:peptidoglycan/xylan/chitin deacetylase (PgdA/CDA1 family)
MVVLGYHSIHPSRSFASATPALFEAHLAFLTANCNIVPFADTAVAACPAAGRPRVAITFDDGYVDNYEYAFPALFRREVSATFFLTAGLIERDPAVVRRFALMRRAAAQDVEPLSWAQVLEMRRAGMDIGAHTRTHPNLAALSRSAAREELRVSKQIIEQRLSAPVALMAYPFGKPGRHFTPENALDAQALGYGAAAAVLWRSVRQADSRYAIPRFLVSRDDVRTLEQKIRGGWDYIGAFQQWAPEWLARGVSPRDFDPIPA